MVSARLVAARVPRSGQRTAGSAAREITVMLARLARPFRTIARFLKEVWGELQRVVWPSHDDTYAFTGVVLVAVGIVALWVGLLDFIFTKLVGALRLYR